MGKQKETNTTVTKVSPTPMERNLNQLNFDLIQALLKGAPLPGAYGRDYNQVIPPGTTGGGYAPPGTMGISFPQIPGGGGGFVGPGTGLYGGIDPWVTQNIVNQSLADVAGQANLGGMLDSGVRAAISGRVSGDIRTQAEMFNIQNRMNLLGMGLGGATDLGGRLAGLRGTMVMGTTKSPNPFVTSFQQTLGQTLGKVAVAAPLYAIPGVGPAMSASVMSMPTGTSSPYSNPFLGR